MWLARKLGARLTMVASLVEGEVLADIGSDHGYLPAFLLRSGRVRRAICVEKSVFAFSRCQAALSRVEAEVRLGDGLSVLAPGEVDCLTMCGFGGRAMARVLRRGEELVPPRVVLQPANGLGFVADWASYAGYSLEIFPVGRFTVVLARCAGAGPSPRWDGSPGAASAPGSPASAGC